MTTDSAEVTATTPEVTPTPEPTQPELPAEEPVSPDAPVETTPDTAAADDSEGGDSEAEAPPSDTPETPKDRTDIELEEAWEKGEDLPRKDIDRLVQIHAERQRIDQEREIRTQELRQTYQTGATQVYQAFEKYVTDPNAKSLLWQQIANTFNSLYSQEGAAHLAPIYRDYGKELQAALVQSGMSVAQAEKQVNSTLITDLPKALLEAGKKLSNPKVTWDAIKKSNPEIVKAAEREFHNKYPERGGNARPGSNGAAAGGVPSMTQWQGMTLEQRHAAIQKDPTIEAKIAGLR